MCSWKSEARALVGGIHVRFQARSISIARSIRPTGGSEIFPASTFLSQRAWSPWVSTLLKVLTSPPTNARLGSEVGITLRYKYNPSLSAFSLVWRSRSRYW
eukprot:3074503-Prymnesium_polylepis.1